MQEAPCPRGDRVMKAQRKKILVADCHEDVLIIMEKLLEDAGFDTTTVWTARDAVRLVNSRAFDLVLVSEYLPDADCEGVLKALEKRGEPTPCIVMQPSAPEMVDFIRLAALRAKDIVCKYCFRQIVELVREYLVCDGKRLAA
jgi:DNA-binding NtrC family response regulator